MKSCNSCHHIIGRNYGLMNDSICYYCDEPAYIRGLPASYEGMNGAGFHVYRVHPVQICSGCGSRLFIVTVPCEDLGFNGVYAELFRTNADALRDK